MRFLPHTPQTRAEMLRQIGVKTAAELYQSIPNELKISSKLNLPEGLPEHEVEAALEHYAAQNLAATEVPFFLGAGCYRHHIPATVDHLIQRGEFLTAYTPYQPEVSQGTLAAIFEFQSMVAALTGQEVANASMYDGATAAAEAALMAMRIRKCSKVAVHPGLHPHYREVLQTYVSTAGGTLVSPEQADNETACLLVQSPDFYGEVHNISSFLEITKQHQALLVHVFTEAVALGMIEPWRDADIVAGEGQSIGNPMSFGGPHLGLFACKKQYVRQMPGRLVGATTDAAGKQAFVLTLNTREQHIRREKATSNICTNQGLCALAFTIHLSLLGETGIKQLALHNHAKACQLADALASVAGVTLENTSFFNEFVAQLPLNAETVQQHLLEQGIISGHPLQGNRMLFCATELITDEDIKALVSALKSIFA